MLRFICVNAEKLRIFARFYGNVKYSINIYIERESLCVNDQISVHT